MAELTAFDARLGFGQGRIQPTGATPDDGDFAFVLGEDLEGFFADLDDGDFVDIEQTFDVTGVDLVRFGQVDIRSAGDEDAESLAWEVTTLLDGTPVTVVRARSGRTRVVPDLAIDLHSISGSHTVGLRLRLVTA